VACEEGSYQTLVASNVGFHSSKKLWIVNVFVSWNNLKNHPTLASDYSYDNLWHMPTMDKVELPWYDHKTMKLFTYMNVFCFLGNCFNPFVLPTSL
jgi:hypothetical protein